MAFSSGTAPAILACLLSFTFSSPTIAAAESSSPPELTTESPPEVSLRAIWTSPSAGDVDNACLDVPDACGKDASFSLSPPPGHVVMISFPVFELSGDDHVILTTTTTTTTGGRAVTARRVTPQPEFWFVPARVLNASLVFVQFKTPDRRQYESAGFQMRFSFHPEAEAPRVVPASGRLDCSGPNYESFRQHVDCNFFFDCDDEEDFRGCPRYEATSRKAYWIFKTRTRRSGQSVFQKRCLNLGGTLATLDTSAEWDVLTKYLDDRGGGKVLMIGYQGFDSALPHYYKHAFLRMDNTVAYAINITRLYFGAVSNRVCLFAAYTRRFKRQLSVIDCEGAWYTHMCQIQRLASSSGSRVPVELPPLTTGDWERLGDKLTLVQCPTGGHLTHRFLLCDPDSQCGHTRYPSVCVDSFTDPGQVSVPQRISTQLEVRLSLFACETGDRTLPYTLVCDYRRDCEDGSDEEFCLQPPGGADDCLGFTCRNGQCVEDAAKVCDDVKDCWDASDEECEKITLYDGTSYRIFLPSVVRFDGEGNYTQTPLKAGETCPPTHFRCGDGNCMPVFVRCNGVYDCMGHEDEADCSGAGVTCGGYYRCRASSVCLHPDNLCDGWPQCPQRDDERLCGALCPPGCLCQGLAFVCPRSSFSPSAFPQLRYLDAERSAMTPRDVSTNGRLAWLSLASCGLTQLDDGFDLPNLRVLDLSDNRLTALNMSVFLPLTNLRELRVRANPVVSLWSGESGEAGLNATQQTSLLTLDLSFSLLASLGSRPLADFPKLRSLNASFSRLVALSDEGLTLLSELVSVDLTGNPSLDVFPVDVFRGLAALRSVRSDNFRLCCEVVLPLDFLVVEGDCLAPRDEISSCEDLLRTDVYRAFLWILSLLACLGNAGCLLFRLSVTKSSTGGFNVFTASLCVADLLMGVYLAMVGAADLAYRGQYFAFERAWTIGAMCQAAGFLSLLSCETSAAMICLITLDRLLVLRFPFSRFHFKRGSATMTCCGVWLVFLAVAGLPLLPATAHWRFYSQTGVCIPLPITRTSFPGQDYAFAVLIALNLVLFLLIAAGQAAIFSTIRATALTANTSKKLQDMKIARLLTSIVVSDFLCWFPIGVLGVLATSGVPVPGVLNVVVAIFVLPLNSAINPFLYTVNTILERWDREKERRMLNNLGSLPSRGGAGRSIN